MSISTSPIGPRRSPTRTPHLLNAGLLIAMFAYAFVTYDDLPPRFAIHFDGAGNPDGWMHKNWGEWLLIPLSALGLTAVMYLTSLLVNAARRNPKRLSIPHKEAFLALPPEQQAPIWAKLKAMVLASAVPLNAILFYVQMSIARFALGQSDHVALWPVIVLGAGMIVILIVQVVDLIRSIKRAVG